MSQLTLRQVDCLEQFAAEFPDFVLRGAVNEIIVNICVTPLNDIDDFVG